MELDAWRSIPEVPVCKLVLEVDDGGSSVQVDI